MRVFPILMALAMATGAWASEASKLYNQGRKAEKKGQVSRAYLLYSEAAALEPENRLYWSRTMALQSKAALESKVMPQMAAKEAAVEEPVADAALEPEPEPDDAPLEPMTIQDRAEVRKPLPPAKLNAKPGVKDFNLRGDSKVLFQAVAKAYGLDCIFDGDYHATPAIHFQMDQVDYREALHALEAVTGSFLVPISDRLFMVVKDTAQKRKEEEPYAAVIIPLPEPTTQQELSAMVTAVQQACGIQKVSWDSHENIVMMRDAVSKVLPAKQLFQDLLYPRAQVLVEMEFYEVSKTRDLHFGFPLPGSFPLASFSNFMHNVPQLASNVTSMLRFGGGATLFAIGSANLQLLASLSTSDSKLLLRSTVRSIDGQAASLHVGQKYPILTGAFVGTGGLTGSTGSQYVPPPSFTFEDLGLSLKATPHVHGTDDVTLTVEGEFKVLAGTALNGIPIIANRQIKSDVSLKMGEWAVVAGLINAEEARTLSGIAGLGGIPLIGPLTSNVTHNKSADQVLILMRTTLLTQPPDAALTHVLRMGAESRPLTPL